MRPQASGGADGWNMPKGGGCKGIRSGGTGVPSAGRGGGMAASLEEQSAPVLD